MRNLSAVVLLFLASLFAMTAPTLAQSNLRVCAAVDLTAPADGAALDPGYRANFTWDSEPRGTASREWVSVRVDLDDDSFSFEDAKKAKAEPRSYKGFARGRPGVYAWAVIFYDRNGNPICQSEARTYVVVGGGFASLSETSSSAAAIKAALGRYIIRLSSGDNTFYTGPANRQVASKDYDDSADADNWQALGYTGLEIYGSQHSNQIKGSNLSDVIHGGNESCLGGCGDIIDGADGNDTINGGNESCLGACGDILTGGNGDDTINGGDESCFALCGDIIAGGDGADTLNGGGGTDGIDTGGNDGDLDTGSGGLGPDIINNGPGDTVSQ